jgi:hypothetical protein
MGDEDSAGGREQRNVEDERVEDSAGGREQRNVEDERDEDGDVEGRPDDVVALEILADGEDILWRGGGREREREREWEWEWKWRGRGRGRVRRRREGDER